MEAAKAANITVGERVEIYVIDSDEAFRGRIIALDEHGLALSFAEEGMQFDLAYCPWSTVTGVYWLGEDNE